MTAAAVIALHSEGGYNRIYKLMSADRSNRTQRIVDILRRVIKFLLDNERSCALNTVLIHTTNDTLHGVICQGTNCVDTVLFLDLRLGVKYGVAGQTPVDDFRSGTPRL